MALAMRPNWFVIFVGVRLLEGRSFSEVCGESYNGRGPSMLMRIRQGEPPTTAAGFHLKPLRARAAFS